MRTLFEGNLGISYRQFYISLHEDNVADDFDMDSYFVDQRNGLVGAAQDNFFFISAPWEVPVIRINVNLLDFPPDLDLNHDEIVEVSCIKGEDSWYLSQWGWEETHKLDIPNGSYRMRLSVAGYDLEYYDDTNEEPTPGQTYLFELWPAPKSLDQIVKQTSFQTKELHESLPITKDQNELKREEYFAAFNDNDPWWKFW